MKNKYFVTKNSTYFCCRKRFGQKVSVLRVVCCKVVGLMTCLGHSELWHSMADGREIVTRHWDAGDTEITARLHWYQSWYLLFDIGWEQVTNQSEQSHCYKLQEITGVTRFITRVNGIWVQSTLAPIFWFVQEVCQKIPSAFQPCGILSWFKMMFVCLVYVCSGPPRVISKLLNNTLDNDTETPREGGFTNILGYISNGSCL